MNSVSPTSTLRSRLFALILAICLFFCTVLIPTIALADTVQISDPVGVLSQSQIKSEGSRLSYPLNIFTTNTYRGSASGFDARTISHLTSTRLIVMAIDTYNRRLSIMGGSSVPLSKSQYASAGTAFKQNFSGDYTNATLAAIRSLETSLGISPSSSSSISGGVFSNIGAVVCCVGLLILIIGSVIFGAVRKMFGFGGNSAPVAPSQPSGYNTAGNSPSGEYRGDFQQGADNFGAGASGDF